MLGRARQDLVSGHRLVAEMLTLEAPAQALKHFQQALGIVCKLLAAEPEETQLLRREAHVRKRVAEALRRLGDSAGALQTCGRRYKFGRSWSRVTAPIKDRTLICTPRCWPWPLPCS